VNEPRVGMAGAEKSAASNQALSHRCVAGLDE